MLVSHRETLQRQPFENEAEIERVVQDFAEQLFGPNIVYLPQARITTIGGRGSVPDALVIDVEAEEWYVVEAERGLHGTWEHIAPQVSRQLAAVASPKTRELILRLALDQVSQDYRVKEVFAELGIEELDIHGRLHAILDRPPIIAIPIDAIPKDLREWVETLRNDTKIWVIEKYVSDMDSSRVLYSIPDEALPTLSTRSTSGGRVSTVTRGFAPWQDLMNADVLSNGSLLIMEYGPRGQPRQTFQGVARIMSPSAAAVYCIRKAGSDRRTANGWVSWKTPNGRFLDDLYQDLGSADQDADAAVDGETVLMTQEARPAGEDDGHAR